MNREAGHRVGTMTHTAGQAASSGDAPFYSDRPNRSPRIAQFEPDGAPRPLGGDTTADVVIVGAGIAGIAATFFLLRSVRNACCSSSATVWPAGRPVGTPGS